MTIYSLDILLFLFRTSLLFHVHSNCCFLTCIQISQEVGQVVWYSHLFQNFPQFIVIHTVKGFGIVNKAEIDLFLELTCFFDDSMDVDNLISGSSALSKISLNISKFTVHILLKPGLENFEHYFTSVWDECNCVVVWAFFSIAFPLGLEWKLNFSSPVATAEFSKCSLGITNFLEEISSLSHSIVFLYFFALTTKEFFLISPRCSLEFHIQIDISFLFSFVYHFNSFLSCL